MARHGGGWAAEVARVLVSLASLGLMALLGCGGGGGGGPGFGFTNAVLRGEYAVAGFEARRGCPAAGVPSSSAADAFVASEWGTLRFDGIHRVQRDLESVALCPNDGDAVHDERPYAVHHTGVFRVPGETVGKIPSLIGDAWVAVDGSSVALHQQISIGFHTQTTGLGPGDLSGTYGFAAMRFEVSTTVPDPGRIESLMGRMSYDGSSRVTATIDELHGEGGPACLADCGSFEGTYQVDPDGTLRQGLGDLGSFEGRVAGGAGALAFQRVTEPRRPSAWVAVPVREGEPAASFAGTYDFAALEILEAAGGVPEESQSLGSMVSTTGSYTILRARDSSRHGRDIERAGSGTSSVTTGDHVLLEGDLEFRGRLRSDGGWLVGIASDPVVRGILVGLRR